MRKVTRHLPLLVLALALIQTGCGFHLRGAGDLPKAMEAVYIEGPVQQRVLLRELEYQLLRLGARQVDNPDQASVVLRLESYTEHDRIVAMDSSGFALEKELTAQLRFSVLDPQYQPLLSSRSLQQQASVLVDKDNAIASDRAERDRYDDLQRRLATALINVLRYQLRSTPASDHEAGQQ